MRVRISRLCSTAILAALATALIGAQTTPAAATTFRITRLVSDGSVHARTIDPSLVNPWGMSFSPTGPFWVSDNATGVSTLYNGAGGKIPLTVDIPPPATASGHGTPTGQVFNGSPGEFQVSAGGKTGASAFLFATEDGTISGWAPSVDFTHAINAVDRPNAVYKGLAIGSTGGADYIYAANFNSGSVEMYDSGFGLVKTFTDPTVAAGYAPFNVQTLGDTLYVTFAQQDAAKHDDVGGAGAGYVDAFSLDGVFERRIVSQGGAINSPWGLDIAPPASAISPAICWWAISAMAPSAPSTRSPGPSRANSWASTESPSCWATCRA